MKLGETERVSGEDLCRIGGRFRDKYGLEMDTLTAALLHEVWEIGQRETQSNIENLERVAREMEQLRRAIQPVATDKPWIAFSYGLGRHSWAWTAVLVAGLAVWLHHLRETTTIEYRQARTVVERYPNLVVLEPLVKSANLVERREGTFLEVAPARGKMVSGKNYVVDPARRMEDDAPKILIPLHFK